MVGDVVTQAPPNTRWHLTPLRHAAPAREYDYPLDQDQNSSGDGGVFVLLRL